MKPKLLKLKTIGIAAIALTAFAWTGASAQGVENTPHNLTQGVTGGPGPNTFSGTAEICVFCHTPHGGDDTAEVPLWNRALAAPGLYTTYSTASSSSIDGSVAPVGSVSIACLSCHDGTQAMDTVINAPGSGGYNPLGARMGVDGDWTGSPTVTGVANLGIDLSNDHPVGIQYGGGGQSAASPGATLNDIDFKATENQVINTATVWWVDTELTPDGNRQKTDMQLYTRSEFAAGPEPFVECASCHDPHTENALFLRVSNDGSAVCLACHTK